MPFTPYTSTHHDTYRHLGLTWKLYCYQIYHRTFLAHILQAYLFCANA